MDFCVIFLKKKNPILLSPRYRPAVVSSTCLLSILPAFDGAVVLLTLVQIQCKLKPEIFDFMEAPGKLCRSHVI